MAQTFSFNTPGADNPLARGAASAAAAFSARTPAQQAPSITAPLQPHPVGIASSATGYPQSTNAIPAYGSGMHPNAAVGTSLAGIPPAPPPGAPPLSVTTRANRPAGNS